MGIPLTIEFTDVRQVTTEPFCTPVPYSTFRDISLPPSSPANRIAVSRQLQGKCYPYHE